MNIYSDILSELNGFISASLAPYAAIPAESLRLFGLSSSYYVQEETTAPMVNLDGELSYIYNLDYPLIGYHKMVDSALLLDPKKSVGDKKAIASKADMQLVLIGYRTQFNTEPETIALDLSGRLFDVHIEADKIKGCVTSNRFSTDQLAILKSELQGLEYSSKYNSPDFFTIKINYSLILEFYSNCLTC